MPFMYLFDVLDYLFSFGKAATEQVAKTAKQFRDTVEEKVTELCVQLYEKFSTYLLTCRYAVMYISCM